MNNVITYDKQRPPESDRQKSYSESNSINYKDNKYLKKKKIIISISITALVLIVIVVTIVLLLKYKPWKNKEKKNPYSHEINFEEYTNELIFNTKVNDLKRLYITQKLYEDMKINGISTQMKLIKKRKYDILIISEKECDTKNKKYCNKTFTASIAMASQCLSLENENCEPKILVDLSNNEKTNLRRLNEIYDLKDIPIALCLFTLIDTNIITSISCPESLPKNIKDELLSDLSYFRPLAKKSSDRKDQMNITIDNDIKIITRKSTGLCDIKNRINSHCDVDLIITKDSEGNLLSSKETSLSNITTNKLNGLNITKITQLIDETSKISNLNPYKYKLILNDLLDKLNPYMKYEEIFFMDKLIKNKKIKNKNNNKRYLTNNDTNNYLIKEQSLFNKEIFVSNLSINLKIDSGINVESSKTFSNLKFDETEKELDKKSQSTDLNKAIKKLLALSKAGNYIAYKLYEKIKNNLDNLTQEITIKIANLNSLIVYKDLTEIFDSTLSLNSLTILPIDIIEESNNLFNKLNFNLNELENNGNDNNNYINYLNSDINDYFSESFDLMNKTFINLNKLRILLDSPKNKYTEISNIYSINTPTSYLNIIQEVNNLYLKYEKDEYDIIDNKINSVLNEFENNYFNSIQQQINIVNNLNTKIQNKYFTIENATKDDYQKIINNINNSNNITSNILIKIKDKIKTFINSKKNEFTLLNIDKNKFNRIINKSNETAYKLDNDEIVDKIYDTIMLNFINNFTNIIKYMDKIKEEKFTLIETLNEGIFTSSQKDKIKRDISDCGVNILNTIKNETNDYINIIRENIVNFINDNFENLNSIIFDLNILLSEPEIKELSILYEIGFNSSINKIKNDILNNKKLIEEYYNEYNDILEDKVSLFNEFTDYTIWSNKKITRGYLRKYNIYKNIFSNIKEYINNQLNNDFFDEYKKIITKIKESLQIIKNNKISDIYPSISIFNFNDKHINNIEDISNLINKYFSFDIFNNNYLPIINDFKNELNEEIENITNYIENQNTKLNKLEISQEEADDDDICLAFKIEVIYLGESYYYDTDDFCATIIRCYNNYKKLVDISIYFDKKFQQYINKFQNLLSLINIKTNSYNSLINNIKDSLSEIKQETINKNNSTDYLLPIKNQINSIISEQYGEKIIRNAYNYYKNNIDEKIENILNNIDKQFIDSYNLLEQEINNNLSKFKYSIEGFSYMSKILKDLITEYIIKQYSDRIINLQKKEMNYTISSYYNYLLKIVNTTYLYIINNIPTNEMNLNAIIDLRKNEINEEFTIIIEDIIQSKNDALNNQLNILQVEDTNFFGLNTTINNIISKISKDLNNTIDRINSIDDNKVSDQFSIASNLYLANSENGKQIIEFYKKISDKLFVELNQDKFKGLLDNWIFTYDNIVNRLNISLYNLNKEIYNEFLIVKQNYTFILEKLINEYFTKENILEKINNLYKNEIKELDNIQLDQIKNNVNQILERIKEHLLNESRRLNNTMVLLASNFSKINSTIKAYKENIFQKIKTISDNIINEFKENMINNVYKEYIEKGLNNYITESKKYTKDFEEYNLLNSSYNLRDIIEDIIEDLVNEYKILVKSQIEYKYQLKLKEIYDFEELKKFINNKIDNEYNTYLLTVLKGKAIYNQSYIGYSEYDLNEDIKKDIEFNITININNIKNIFLSTKGDNYEVDLSNHETDINGEIWKTLDFSNIKNKYLEVKELFEKFILSEKNYEKKYIDETIQKTFKEDFKNSLNNLLFSFGNEYFERELKYNQLFRISSLFDNLKISLNQSMSYYFNLNYEKIFALPKDLKNKLTNLNNIELLIEENNNYLITSINTKIKEFIDASQDYLINKYLTYMGNEALISMRFNQEISSMINNNLQNIKIDIENDFYNLIDSNLNEIFIYPYNETLNEEKDKLINLINEFRNKFIIEKGDLFTLESENILEEINTQINITLDSINEYKSHLNVFKLLDEFILYLNNYTINNIKPIYDEFKQKIDEISNNQIILNFEKNANKFENLFDSENFIINTNNLITNLKDNYIDNTNNFLNKYYTNYTTNFEIEVYKLQYNYTRRIEEDEIKKYDKPLDETLKKLLKCSEDSKIYIETLKEFDDINITITKNINNLNIAFKESQIIIQNNNYEEDMNNNFNNKLSYLKEISLDYYKKINESYYNIREYLNQSILNINTEINNCINITSETLINEYKNFSEESEPINVEYSETKENLNNTEYNFDIGETKYYINMDIKNFISYASFQFKIEFENNDYKLPKIIASIINKSRPTKMILEIYSEFGFCGKKVTNINVDFNEANYKMNLNFDTKSDNININTITDFKKYDYKMQIYEIEDSNETNCVGTIISFCSVGVCDKKNIKSSRKFFYDKKELIENNTLKVNLFD